jgi:hypothetical protein
MIEAVIVLSTLLVFLGFIVYFRKAYGAKLDLQQTARANVLYYASHGCTGDGGTASQGTGSVEGSPPAENAAKKANVANKAAASRKWNTANASASEVVSWQTVWDVNAKGGSSAIDLQKQKLGRTITAKSTVTCNEKKYDNQWTAWFQFAVDWVGRGFGGVGDLFR